MPSSTPTLMFSLTLYGALVFTSQGYLQVCMYQCGEAIETLLRLPPAQYSTGWVLCTVGRAYFERVEYAEAERVFEWARRVDPTRLEGMDVFSTVLWHLKKEVDLSYLAQEAVALNRLAPQAWCASRAPKCRRASLCASPREAVPRSRDPNRARVAADCFQERGFCGVVPVQSAAQSACRPACR